MRLGSLNKRKWGKNYKKKKKEATLDSYLAIKGNRTNTLNIIVKYLRGMSGKMQYLTDPALTRPDR